MKAWSLARGFARKIRAIKHEIRQRHPLEQEVVILVTSPRSGSTWLLDMLRCHPGIYLHPRYHVYARLRLRGRRYPRDLSGQTDGIIPIEVRPSRWEYIPQPRLDSLSTQFFSGICNSINIEKIHPSFFEFDSNKFVENVKEFIKDDHRLKFIYSVRDPRMAIVSFLEYKERCPSWYSHVPFNEVPNHLAQTYESMIEILEFYPGLVVDYSQLKANLGEKLNTLFQFIFDSESIGGLEAPISAIDEATSRKKRRKLGSGFIGKDKLVSGRLNQFSALFEECHPEIERCYKAYESLLEFTIPN